MASKVLLSTHGKSFKVWGVDVMADTNGNAEMIAYFGRIGLRMGQLQTRTKKGKRLDMVHLAQDTIKSKCEGEYTAVPNGEYFDLVYDFHDKIEKLIKKHRGW